MRQWIRRRAVNLVKNEELKMAGGECLENEPHGVADTLTKDKTHIAYEARPEENEYAAYSK
ncbi:MAG: hypothetical protein QOG55_1827 [Acidobacteriaceae bacterium]|jgi:hypothetical protein|nr:hypothetical protein [Acidobacteriaceae bacterium]